MIFLLNNPSLLSLSPQVVFSTDASLSCGLSKALLLRWGGDPRCRVIFTDTCNNDDKASLAAELRYGISNALHQRTTPTSSASIIKVLVTAKNSKSSIN